MHFRMKQSAFRPIQEKGARLGPSSQVSMFRRGDLGAQGRRAKGREKAKGQEKHRRETIEEPFEFYERHDTHFPVSRTLIKVRVFLI